LQQKSGVKVLVATGIPADRPDRIAALALDGGAMHRARSVRTVGGPQAGASLDR
jgi:hypothetical protein